MHCLGIRLTRFLVLRVVCFHCGHQETIEKATWVESLGHFRPTFLQRLAWHAATRRAVTHTPTYHMSSGSFPSWHKVAIYPVTGLMSPCTVLVASPWGGYPVSERVSGFAHPCFQSLPQCLEHSKRGVLC